MSQNAVAATVDAPAPVAGSGALLRRMAEAWSSGELPVLGDLQIRVRFTLLVVLALIATVLFGAVIRLADIRIDHMLKEQDSFRRLNDLAGDVRVGTAVLQNLEELFVRERDPAAAEAFGQEIKQMRQRLDVMAELSAGGPLIQAVGAAQVGVETIAEDFAAMAVEAEKLGLTESRGLRGRLNSSSKAIETELSMWQSSSNLPIAMMSVAMARMRLAERDFMLYGRDDTLGRHRAAANQFDLAVDTSPLPNSARDDMAKLLTAYTAAMRAFADGSTATWAGVAKLRADVQALQPEMQQVAAYARQGMAEAIAAQEAQRAATGRMVAMVGLLAAGSFLLACMVLARSVSQPIRLIQTAMERLAGGDNAVGVPGIRRGDEIGDMARAVAVFKENAIAMVRLQAEQQSIRVEAEAAGRARMLALADTFEREVKGAADMVATNSVGIRDTAMRMAARTDAGKNGSLAVVEAADKCRATVGSVAEAAAELGAAVHDITGSVAASSEIVRGAVDQLGRTTERIRSLTEVAGRIDRVVGLITEIAGRTNMLALNATIEAQRAGDAGRGFVVVAHEVKMLALQTAQSTREIAAEVAAIQAATADTAAAIDGIGDTVRRMDGIVAQVSSAAGRQSDATDRIRRCVEDVIVDTTVMSRGVVALTQSAARYCGAAIGVMWAAEDLAVPAVTLDREVDGFLATVRG